MKEVSFNKTLLLFDYFKKAFYLQKSNKQLYTPQIIYLIVRTLLLLLMFFSYLEVYDKVVPLIGNDVSTVINLLWNTIKGTTLTITLTTIGVLIFGSTYVESGLFYMYAKLASKDDEAPAFTRGAAKYFFPFLLGEILIIVLWILALIPYLIVGVLTLSVGFFLIPILVGAFLLVWKASLVVDNKGLMKALGNSINFAKANFVPVTFFVIIRSALSSISGGSGNTSNYSSNMNNTNSDFSNIPNNGPDFGFNNFFDETVEVFRTVYIVVVSLISIMTLITGLIQMLFDIFFGICVVVIYQEAFYIPEEMIQADFQAETGDMEVTSYEV